MLSDLPENPTVADLMANPEAVQEALDFLRVLDRLEVDITVEVDGQLHRGRGVIRWGEQNAVIPVTIASA